MTSTPIMLDRLPDERLVALVRAGREEAFAALVRRYREPLLAYARRMLHGSGQDPEDVLQEAFIRAHAGLCSSDASMAVRPWLYTIVRNRCLDALRSPLRGRGDPEDELAVLAAPHADPAGVYARHVEMQALASAVAALPERQRAALLLHVIDGRPHQEVAGTLHTTVQATKSLVNRARAALIEEGGAAA